MQSPDEDREMADEARRYVHTLADQLKSRGCNVTTLTDWRDPARCIVAQLREHQADLVVIGTHGRSAPGRWLYGSVADEVMRGSPAPVVLIPPAVTSPTTLVLKAPLAVPRDIQEVLRA